MTKQTEALKLALEALENHCGNYKLDDEGVKRFVAACNAIKEALAPTSTQCEVQPEQEPVAWMHTKIEGVAVPHRPADLDKHPDRWTALYKDPPPCPTCEALARTVMLDQTSHDQFKPDWDTQAVLVEEMQRMAKRIEDLEAMLEQQTARIVDLQTHIENFDGEDR